MPATPRSVVYLLQADEFAPEPARLANLQQQAMAKKLPLAVVYCLDETEHQTDYRQILDRLRPGERQLAVMRIPLMVLVGDRTQRFEWFSEYVRPQVGGRRTSPVTTKLVDHPYPWPGTVMTIDELQPLIDKNKLMC